MTRTPSITRLLPALAALALLDCEAGTMTDAGIGTLSLLVVSGNNQSGVVGAQLTQPLVVKVVNPANKPVKGQIVNFRVTAGGGSVFAGAALTNDRGLAQELWTLGTVAGAPQTVEVRAVDPSTGAPLVFGTFNATAVADVPAVLEKVAGDGQSGAPGGLLPQPLRVHVADQYGNATAGVTVTWSVITGAGSLSPATTNTDATGTAETRWTLGGSAGDQMVAATVGPLAATFTATSIIGVIVFDYYNGTNRDIYRINPDGSGLAQITSFTGGNPGTSNEYPDLSHDRTKIVFTREWNIWSMRVDGSDLTQLTFRSPNTLPQVNAAWSPDGTTIAFESQFACCTPANREVHVMNADGSGETRLTTNVVYDGEPFWSPDGARLVFQHDNEIYLMDADGGNVARLTNDGTWDGLPHVSPDGSKVLFASMRDGHMEVYVMNLDGSGQTRLTYSPSSESGWPDWSPDGSQIVFDSSRSGGWDLYIMNADGSGVTRLTNFASVDRVKSSWQ